MLKPRLVKSLITQNAALLREKQQLLDYLRAVEMTLRAITKHGKDSGVVELKDLFTLAADMRGITTSYDLHNFEKMGTLRSPTKRDLGKMAEADQNIMHGFFSGSAEEMNEFFSKMINDLMKFKPPPSDMPINESDKFFQFPVSPDKFGADLEGEWQDSPPPDQDPFSDLDLDKPE
jgi:hypothetical protein